MEDNQNQETESQNMSQEAPQSAPSGISFPTVGEQKKSGGSKMILIIGILILVGILGFVIYKSASKKSNEAITEPTPFDNLSVSVQDTNSPSPAASATPKAADKAAVKIQVQNGTGITGEAAYLQTQLKGLGYTNVSVGNSAAQNLTSTQVSFGSSLSSAIVAEITAKLESIYQKVTTTTSTSTTYDVVITTGLRKGATAKPSATPKPSASPTVKPTASASATPTATATPH